MLAIFFIIASMLLNALAANLQISSWIFISVYLIANIFYSFKLKNIPLIDVTILSSGFILRVLYGGAITQISVSNWLLLVLMSFSFFMGFGKRRNEIRTKNESARTVLKHYKYNFLNSNLYVCLALTVMFYAMWSIDMSLNFDGKNNLVWTTFAVLFISLRYSMNIENQESADPIDVLFGDKILTLLIAAYVLMMFFILYGGNLL
jgi:4-hydroxybenzoate polyprenyltransferase